MKQPKMRQGSFFYLDAILQSIPPGAISKSGD
jgi:hypothetical protein